VGEPIPAREAVPDRNLREATRLWLGNGLKPGSVAVYRPWVLRFIAYCKSHGRDKLQQLTQLKVREFAEWYARKRRIRRLLAREAAHKALHAWSNALASLGVSVPEWSPIASPIPIRMPIVREFIDYRRRHGGVSVGTLQQDQATSLEFAKFLHGRKHTWRTVRLGDVDAFSASLGRRVSVGTLASRLCSVRALLRFLHASGRLRFDLAASVVGPMLKPDRYPPKALPWSQVRQVLRAVNRGTRMGRRDYAILLLMSLYGLGGAEVVTLRLEDINWDRKTLCVLRPKTQATILLPLLPAAARALASYIQHSRPSFTHYRQVFLRSVMPHRPFTGSTGIAHMLTKYGQEAGVTTGPLGSHVLRHSQATRQVELGTPLKLVGDILGHRYPESTSAYTRSAVRRLRDLALPLPHA
jgi:integrase/recombinase XerD